MPRLLPGREPACKVSQTVVQSIPAAAWAAVLMDAEDYDPMDMHSTASNTSRITVPKDGLYIASGVIGWAIATGGARYVSIGANGAQTDKPNM
ncbi:MAG: hypothetical protein ACR2HR_03190, partial [Euzebya sp.]